MVLGGVHKYLGSIENSATTDSDRLQDSVLALGNDDELSIYKGADWHKVDTPKGTTITEATPGKQVGTLDIHLDTGDTVTIDRSGKQVDTASSTETMQAQADTATPEIDDQATSAEEVTDVPAGTVQQNPDGSYVVTLESGETKEVAKK